MLKKIGANICSESAISQIGKCAKSLIVPRMPVNETGARGQAASPYMDAR